MNQFNYTLFVNTLYIDKIMMYLITIPRSNSGRSMAKYADND